MSLDAEIVAKVAKLEREVRRLNAAIPGGAGGSSGGVPVGAVIAWTNLDGPPDATWLVCDGSSVAAGSYPALFSVIGYDFGGSGANFNLPDLTGRVIAGYDAGSTYFGLSSKSRLGHVVGVTTVTITEDQMPSHTHTYASGTHSVSALATGGLVGTTSTSDSGSTGGDAAHANIQPSMVLYWMIRAA